MLRQIPTAHPAIIVASLAVLSGLEYFLLHGYLQTYGLFVAILVGVVITVACQVSEKKRAKVLREKYSGSKRPGSWF